MESFKLNLVLFFLLLISEIEGQECGVVKQNLGNRVANGKQTLRGDWPFLAALYYSESSEYFCGSTVITNKHVLTAAHCVFQKFSTDPLEPDDVLVLLGRHNLDAEIEKGAVQRDVAKVVIHPQWDVKTVRYDADLSILQLKEIFDFSDTIRPICLPSAGDTVGESRGSVIGWGRSENTGSKKHESIPRVATVKPLNDSYCYTAVPELSRISSTRIFCGGRETPGDGSPGKGDSGGGFFVKLDNVWIQHGIVSSSLSDKLTGELYGFILYTNVALFKDWIDDVVESAGSHVFTKTSSLTNQQKVEDIWCNFEIQGDYYTCSVWGVNVREDYVYAGKSTGKNLEGYTDRNVTKIWVWNGNFSYIPDGVGLLFPNIQRFLVSYDDELNLGLKVLRRRNFLNMPNMISINVNYNKIEKVDEDSLWDLPNLKEFKINNNKLSILHKQTFARNPKLSKVIANSNQLEVLDQDLFIKNPLLTEVFFKDNKLKTIGIDFSKFSFLRVVDFAGNACIDKNLNNFESMRDFVEHLKKNC